METLSSYLNRTCSSRSFAKLMGDILPGAIKKIRIAIEQNDASYAKTQNTSGENQLKLDVVCNSILKQICAESNLVKSFASEEEEDQIEMNESGEYTICADPLDGSSLMNVNFAVGTIIGIYPAGSLFGKTGREQIGALIAIYGPKTTLVFSCGKGTHECELKDGNFFVTKENITIKEDAEYFAPGNLRAAAKRPDYAALVNSWINAQLTLRYSGGMVPDINHIFIKGSGIFSYPGYPDAPNGKLRVLYECAPMAYLMENANGAASTGEIPVLDIKILQLAQRTPIYIGSKNTVLGCCKCLK